MQHSSAQGNVTPVFHVVICNARSLMANMAYLTA